MEKILSAHSAISSKTGQKLFFNSNSQVGSELQPLSTRAEFSERAVLQCDSPQSLNTLPVSHFNKLINGDSTTKNLMTPKRLAEFLGISKSSVYLLVETRKLPFYKVGGSLRFKMTDIEEYLKTVRVEPIVPKKYGHK